MKRRVGVFVFVALALGGATFGACTIFDGLDAGVTSVDGASESSVVDASTDGLALPPNTQPGYLSVADGVAFCSNAFACPLLTQSVEFSIDVPVDANHFSSCVNWVSGPLPEDRVGHDDTAQYLKCAAQATSCAAAGGCMWDDIIAGSDPRCVGVDSGANGICEEDASAIYFCNGTSTSAVEHCGNGYFPAGFSCLVGKDKEPYCATKTCTGDQCSGAFIEFCGATNMLFNGWDCNVGGFTCGYDNTEGYNDCLTNGTAILCNQLGITCKGDVVALCDSVYESHYDCNNYGATCDQTGFPRCKLPTESCTPLDADVDICSGNTISLCLDGQKTSFDCSSIGKTCASGSNGQSGHCQ